MATPLARFTLDQGRIRLADSLFVYLERTLAPDGPVPVDVPPRGYGLAPTAALSSGSVIGAVAPGEAVWLGFQAVDPARPATVRVRLEAPQPLDAVTGGPWTDALVDDPPNYLVCPPASWLTGVREPTGYRLFGNSTESETTDFLEELSVIAPGGTPALVRIDLATPETFTRLTGQIPQPLDPDHAYKGWRLP